MSGTCSSCGLNVPEGRQHVCQGVLTICMGDFGGYPIETGGEIALKMSISGEPGSGLFDLQGANLFKLNESLRRFYRVPHTCTAGTFKPEL
jgi:hypothetical protein